MFIPSEIKQQKELMQSALDKLYFLEHVPDIIRKFDNTRAAVVTEELCNEYVCILTELTEKLILSGVKSANNGL